jgi:zinc/manganese transport system substrate-binding protein
MPRRRCRASLLVACVSVLLVLTGCGPGPGTAAGDRPTPGGPIRVVTSTNVYGDIAQQVGGDAVQVTAIVSDPAQDPHSFEANTQVALELSKAQLVVENGGGYDDFVDTMLRSGKSGATVLNAVTISGLRAPAGGELNEHVWYSIPSMQKVADRIADELGRTDPSRAETFTANARRFGGQLDRLTAVEARLKSSYAGVGVGLTEPVPLYLLGAIGLVNKTPEEFSEAVEEGEDVSAAVLKETLDLYATRQVRLLVPNAQTSGPVTDQVTAAAQRAGVPVVPVTETLPRGQDYQSWMQDNLDRIGRALAQR